ncbi:MAG: SpoIIE family protein phosphatase [Candidatus Hydrogenedens sp.]|nr:SpoIIE family protein phosphatase [Candidatus Hydrogenedens sp.]
MTLKSALLDLLSPDAIRKGILGPRHPAFEIASRRSQLLRLRVVIGLCFTFIAMVLTRRMLVETPSGFREMFSLVLAATVYEIVVYIFARRAEARDESLPLWFWKLNAVVESVLPTIAMILLSGSGEMPPQRTLVSPVLMLYPFFIVTGILSLRPSIPFTNGLASACGYALLLAYSRSTFNAPPDDPLPFSVQVVIVPLLFLLGLAGAWVAARIRGYALAEIQETARRENAEHGIRVAGKIQEGLLPREAPESKTFQVAGWNRPAEMAGGDYYDWIPLPGGRLAAVLADVSGHGLGPALVAALCRSYLRAVLRQSGMLAEALGLVNTLLRDDLPPGWFVTLAVAIAHEDSGRVELFSAGHGPNYVYRSRDRSIESFAADTPPLGVLDTLGGQGIELTLEPGDFLVLASDGFHEWPRDDGARFGIERYRETVLEQAGHEPAALIAGILATVEQFAEGSAQPDDMSMVVLQRG